MGKSGQFDKLLGELNAAGTQTDTLAKALSSGGEGGAGEGGESGQQQQGGGEGGGGQQQGNQGGGTGEGEGGEGGEDMTKGFIEVMGPDGKPVKVVDGTEMLKALGAELDASSEVTAKAMSTAVDLIVKQGTMIGALTKQVQEQGVLLKSMSGEGRGRKAMLNLHEKTDTLAKGGMGAQQGGGDAITAADFMLKAETAFNAKKITGEEFTTIDVALRTRQRVDAAILRKVVVATAAA